MGTLLIPGMLALAHAPILIGYAKPVPVNFAALRPKRWGPVAVALAGPAINLILAFISALLLHLDHFISPERAPMLFQSLYISVSANIVIAVFNMLPVLPLDGGRVLNALLPPKLAASHVRSERYGMLLVFALLLVPPMLKERGYIDNTMDYYLIQRPAESLLNWIYYGAGIGLS